MNEKQYYKNLIYLNAERIKTNKSKELFIGKKVEKYIKLVTNLQIIRIMKELVHDIYAFFFKNVSKNQIMDFSVNAIEKFPEKVIVYTSIYGSYDTVSEPLSVDPNCEYYIFTDQEIPKGSLWIKADDSFIPESCNTPAKKNRYVKMFPFKAFNCIYSIYLDGNLQIVGHPSQLVQKQIDINKTGIAMHLAPRENCIYEEAANLCHVGKITHSEKTKVIKMYKRDQMPRHYGMCECNVIVRNHKNNRMKEIMEKWWDYYVNGVKRDQLYFTYILYKMGYKFEDIMTFGASVNDNIHFLRKDHEVANMIKRR